ncbi:MAG: RtcB family protein [Planctomycetota bacterium]|nr:RtcB family protein [Planctomycetota bacterium]MDI6788769.1 RtcB family protein [Planctomycetota bacterium]
MQLEKITDYLWEIPKHTKDGMNVPGRIYASKKLLDAVGEDKSPEQVANVACLPGIVGYSLAMPDIHWGYGFPIGGVAAFDIEKGGVISPGGVGYDINCGVRMMRTALSLKDVLPKLKDVLSHLYHTVPSGVGSSGAIATISRDEERRLLTEGARWAVGKGYGSKEDLEHIEDNGVLTDADPSILSDTAIKRGLSQVGTLGSGNHFLEIDKVVEIYRPEIASVFGIAADSIVIQIHSGSRGLGYQICDDYVRRLLRASEKYGIKLLDRQLACAPVNSPEGKEYLSAMACAANYAWVNRQVIMHLTRESLMRSLQTSPKELGAELIYDVCHNIAKIEEHLIEGNKTKVCVHRKGATRAFPPNHPAVPKDYQKIGQPVLVPGDMGRSSFLCVGTDEAMKNTFGSTCHGAGRVASRTAMIKKSKGKNLYQEMESMGVLVMTKSHDSMAEEMPSAYKDVSEVVEVMELAGISKKVAKFKPLGVIKG